MFPKAEFRSHLICTLLRTRCAANMACGSRYSFDVSLRVCAVESKVALSNDSTI